MMIGFRLFAYMELSTAQRCDGLFSKIDYYDSRGQLLQRSHFR